MPSRKGWQGEPHKWGGPLSLHDVILNRSPLFSLTQEAQRKKLGKKEMPQENFAPCEARPTLRALDRRRLLEKAGENFKKA